jgi:ATP-dependent RNA helicase DDX24/MAK5
VDVTLFQEEDGVGNLTSTVRMDGRDDFGTDKTMHDDNSIDTGGKRKASSMTRNHYDDPKLSRRASKDLPMNPGEDCAMFLGLEVLDSSQYQVVNDGTSKRIVILTDSPDTTTTTTNSDKKGSKKKQEPPLSVPMEELDNNNNDGTKKSTNKKRRKSDTTTSIGSPIEGVTTIKPLTSDHQPASTVVENKKKSKRSKIEDKASSSTEYVSSSAHFKSADVELVTEPDEQNDPGQMTSTTRKKKKKKPKKKSSNTTSSTTDDANKEEGATFVIPMSRQPLSIVTPDQLATIQASWGGASGGAHLHKRLMESLFRLGFIEPTPIQAATLSASVMGRRNLVGAAPTGSGKTLAFLLPILNAILESTSTDDDDNATAVDEDDNADDDDANVEVDDPKQGRQSSRPPIHGKRGPIQALIMTPTRELASQIHAECDKLLPNQCATLVGGIALVKQARILQTKRPPIVIATPGRLWAMVR